MASKSTRSREVFIVSDSDDEVGVGVAVAPRFSKDGPHRGYDRKSAPEAPLTRERTTAGSPQSKSGLLAALDEGSGSDVGSPPPLESSVTKKRKKTEQEGSAAAAERAARKEQDRRDKQYQKAVVKAAKEADKSYQKKLSEVNKLRISKSDTVREIHVFLSADLGSPDSPIAGALPEIQSRFRENFSSLQFMSPEETEHHGIIRFKRHVRAKWEPKSKRFVPLDDPRWVWDDTFIAVLTAEELMDKLTLGDGELARWAGGVRSAVSPSGNHDEQMVVMIKGLEKYHAKSRSLANREFAVAARAGLNASGAVLSHRSRPGREAVDEEVVRLQVAQGCFMVFVERTEDIEDWIYNLAADVAIRPYKLLSKSHLNFCPADGVKKGATASDAFELMLQEVQGITSSAATGIVSEYPTFRDLMTAYDRAGTMREGLLEDCQIRNLRNGVPNGRRLNKALSKRVYQALQGDDGLSLV